MKRRTAAILMILGVLTAISVVLLIFVESRVREVRTEMGELTARNKAASAILNGVEETIKDADLYYSELVQIVRDENGDVKSLITDTARLNTVSNAVNRNVDKRISDIKSCPVKIPITSLTGEGILSGLGPCVTFYVTVTGTASTSFENVFDSAGVNQTRHQIMLKVTVKTYVILGRSVNKYTVTTDLCIAENIIVGITPDAIAQLQQKS